jgi:UDP-N-acetylmuramoyl-L-alanyl-D-glutamate--2,6-diaminopimelate ligase
MMAARIAARQTTLGELLGPAAGELASLPIADLVIDSRDVRPGAAFVAVPGGTSHGLAHAEEAFRRGAAAVLYEPAGSAAWRASLEARDSGAAGGSRVAPSGRRMLAVPGLAGRLGELAQKLYAPRIGAVELAGVTGTNGKSTVAYLVAQAATRRGAGCGYIGTLGYGVPPELDTHALTTPDTFTLHRELAALGQAHAALEVSSHALAQDRIAGLTFGVAAFTNLTRDHLDEHGDLETYARAKARLFDRPGLRRAVLNMGDPFAARLLGRLPAGVEAIRVRLAPPGSVSVELDRGKADVAPPAREPALEVDLEADLEDRGLAGIALEVSGRYGRARLESPLIGDFNAENLLVALGVLVAWDMPLAGACAALEHASPAPGRLEVVGADPTRPTVIVDYAHTPDGLDRVLRVLDGVCGGELWCVFGCGGERDRGKRSLMGAVAAEWADHLVLTDDNPRGEDPAAIVADIRASIDGPEARSPQAYASLTIEHDRARAIALAIGAARPGDVVLVAGKGHETIQIAGDARRPFSDRDAVLDALRGRA